VPDKNSGEQTLPNNFTKFSSPQNGDSKMSRHFIINSTFAVNRLELQKAAYFAILSLLWKLTYLSLLWKRGMIAALRSQWQNKELPPRHPTLSLLRKLANLSLRGALATRQSSPVI